MESNSSVVAEALSRSESYRAEVEMDLSKERSDGAALRDLLVKVQALNEGLAQDKIELNKIILLVEQEKNSIHNEKSDVEQDKSTLRQVRNNALVSHHDSIFEIRFRNLSESNKRRSTWKMIEIVSEKRDVCQY